jgi:hypothetical protein
MLVSLARLPAAAVLGEKADELVHGPEIGAVDDEAPFVAAAREPCPHELRQMKRQRRGRQIEGFADPARRQALRARLDEQAEGSKPRFLSERTECRYD